MPDDVFELQPPSKLRHARHVIDYIFCLAYGMITLEILLELAGASDSSGFKQFLNAITSPLLGPFVGLFSDPLFDQRYRFRVCYVVALVIYMLVHLAAYGLLRLIGGRKPIF